jgi:aspartyl aminopeptidase
VKGKLATETFLERSVTAWHAVREMETYLAGEGFLPLKEEEVWRLEEGRGYYFIKNGRSLAAFRAGRAAVPRYRIITAHTDSPHLRLKTETLARDAQGMTGNVAVYGGPIVNTWLDRPLGLAGAVMAEGKGGRPERILFDSQEPVGIIPNAAIHLNRDVNKGFEIKPQKHLSVVLAMEGSLEEYLSEKLGLPENSILSIRAELYVMAKPTLLGNGDTGFISGPRLDDLIHCRLGAEALVGSAPGENTPLLLCFDSEETGSRTLEGAQSALSEQLMERIGLAMNVGRESQLRSRAFSSMISADVAHGWNSNFREKYDPAYKCFLNGGPVVKVDHQNKYITTVETEAVTRLLAKKRDIPLQTYIVHSDLPNGSTIGPILSSSSGIPCVDLGVPVWAMHSAMETIGRRDVEWTGELFKDFLEA